MYRMTIIQGNSMIIITLVEVSKLLVASNADYVDHVVAKNGTSKIFD